MNVFLPVDKDIFDEEVNMDYLELATTENNVGPATNAIKTVFLINEMRKRMQDEVLAFECM